MMTNEFLKLAAVSAFALSLASRSLVAQEALGEWDANADGGIDVSEFETGLRETDLFSTWDEDSDDALSEDELGGALGDIHFAAWDADGDGRVRESEFLTGLYSNYDVDASGSLEEEEFGVFEEEALLR